MSLSAPMIWIIFPAMAALILLAISRWARVTATTGVSLSLLLALLAWKLPIGDRFEIGERSFLIETSLVFLGRRMELLPEQQSLLILIYLLAAFWLGGSVAARSGRVSVPLGLAVVTLLTAALAVQPFLYAALLIEMAVLFCVPLLVPLDKPLGRGVLRFLILQTFGMPFILFTGHLLAGIASNPGDTLLTLRVGIMMSLGFGFLLAIFPFHSWLPLLGEESHPYMAAFVYIFLPQMVMLFGLGFLERYAWMRTIPALFIGLRWVGLGMIFLAGLWAAFQSHLGRLLGYAAMLEIGFGVLAIASMENHPDGLILHFALLPARTVALSLWALALAVLQQRTPPGSVPITLDALRGQGWRYPIAATGLLLAMLSLAGMPLMASFAPRFALITRLVVSTPMAALISLVGGVGFLLSALRTLTVLFAGEDSAWSFDESRSQRIFLVAGVCLLLALGLFAPRLLPWFANLAQVFPHLAQ